MCKFLGPGKEALSHMCSGQHIVCSLCKKCSLCAYGFTTGNRDPVFAKSAHQSRGMKIHLESWSFKILIWRRKHISRFVGPSAVNKIHENVKQERIFKSIWWFKRCSCCLLHYALLSCTWTKGSTSDSLNISYIHRDRMGVLSVSSPLLHGEPHVFDLKLVFAIYRI